MKARAEQKEQACQIAMRLDIFGRVHTKVPQYLPNPAFLLC